SSDVEPGGVLDIESLNYTTNLSLNVENVRVASGGGQIAADIQIKSLVDNVGRDVAIVFDDLPSGVSLISPSGYTAEGSPYINFRSAIPHGGLRQSDLSKFITVNFAVS